MYLFFKVISTPVPQPRPRISRNRVYYPGPIEYFKKDVYVAAQREMYYTGQERVENKPVYVALLFIKNARTAIAPRYGDIDNLSKAVLDAMNGLVFADDRQVVGLNAFKACAPKGARKDVEGFAVGDECVDVFVTDGLLDYIEHLHDIAKKYLEPIATNKNAFYPFSYVIDESKRLPLTID